MITINMNSAALCRLEQQDWTRRGALQEQGTTVAGTRRPDARGTTPRPEAAPPMPEHVRG